MKYNPFKKDISAITESDMTILLNTSEGWYIEYKEIVPNSKSIAKSVSAFANSEGGYLFYGIEGTRTGDNFAKSFPGIPLTEEPKKQQNIRDSIISNLDNTPYFEYYVIKPDDTGHLLKDKCIIMIYVPKSYNTPHVHSCGKIYIREADSSNPVPLTEKALLMNLVERSDIAERKFKDLITRDLELSEEENNTTLVVYLFPHLFDDVRTIKHINFDEYTKRMSSMSVEYFNITFDNSYPSSEGYVSRQVSVHSALSMAFTWEHYWDGSSKIVLPLNSFIINGNIPEKMQPYAHYSDFISKAEKSNVFGAELFDLTLITAFVYSIIVKQCELLKDRTNISSLRFKARIENAWRKIPFIDSSTYISQIEEFGFPVIQKNMFFSPPGYSRNSTVSIDIAQDMSKEDYLFAITHLWGCICESVGINIPQDHEKVIELILSVYRGIESYSKKI